MPAVIRDFSKLKAGDEFSFRDSRYKVVERIFHGPFSSVYKLLKDGQLLAMKIESKNGYRNERAVLKLDVLVMRSLAGRPGVVPLHAVGRNANWKALIMKFVGPDLQRLQNLMPERKFTSHTVYHILLQILDRLESLHRAGYLHRDLKAANFAVGLGEEQRTIYMLDFGMCRKYVDRWGGIQLRSRGPICGTIPFASLASNYMEDVGPRDDLENWFFMAIHLIKGHLPWFYSDDEGPHFGQEQLLFVREWKRWSLEVDRRSLFGTLPRQWEEIHDAIRNTCRDEPAPIDKVRCLVLEIVRQESIDTKRPLDWEVFPQLRCLVEFAASQEIADSSKNSPQNQGDI